MHEYIYGGLLRRYGTLRYGGVHEKFNFLKIKKIRNLKLLSKTVGIDVAEYTSKWVYNLLATARATTVYSKNMTKHLD